MEWTRKALKEKAKFSVKAFYWKSVLVAFILALVSGGFGGGSGRGRARQIQAQQHSQCAAQMFHIQANSFRDAPPARTSGADGDSIIQYTYTILTYHHPAKRPRMQEQRRKKRFIWYAFLTRRGPHGTIRGIQKGGTGHGG